MRHRRGDIGDRSEAHALGVAHVLTVAVSGMERMRHGLRFRYRSVMASCLMYPRIPEVRCSQEWYWICCKLQGEHPLAILFEDSRREFKPIPFRRRNTCGTRDRNAPKVGLGKAVMVLVLIHDNGLHITRRIAGYRSHVALCRTHLRLLLEQQLTPNATISFSPNLQMDRSMMKLKTLDTDIYRSEIEEAAIRVGLQSGLANPSLCNIIRK